MEERLFESVKIYFGKDYKEEQAESLQMLVNRAISLFKSKRNYPSDYTDEQISTDIESHESCLFDLIIFWFAKQGAEFEQIHIENNVHRTYMSEDSIFISHMITPFVRVF